MIEPAETMFVKVGKRYRPAHTVIDRFSMTIPVGSFVLIHAYKEGGRLYEHGVKPDNAGFAAAATISKLAMVDAMRKAAPANPQPKSRQYTPQELAIIDKFRAEMAAIGSMVPDWWEYTTPEAIAQAGIDAALPAMREYARKNPKHHFSTDGTEQDPNGAHAWLDRNELSNTTAETRQTAQKGNQ